MSKYDDLIKLREECLSCKKCSIGGQFLEGKPCNVFSNLSLKAYIMVTGQNPSTNEVYQEEPFVGKSGEFFNKAVKEVLEIDRSSFYISNVCRCYTPKNRMPTDEEIDNCSYFLQKEVEIIKPCLLITLGAPSFKMLTGLSGIMQNHGKEFFSKRYNVSVVPLLHPSPLNMNSREKREMFYEDLRKLKHLIFKYQIIQEIKWNK